ncbi:MAG: hypothetical protein ACJ790_02180 [Myxococcaceae bacterium]
MLVVAAHGVNGRATDRQFQRLTQLEQKRDQWAPTELQKADRIKAPPQDKALQRADDRSDRAGREQLRAMGGL